MLLGINFLSICHQWRVTKTHPSVSYFKCFLKNCELVKNDHSYFTWIQQSNLFSWKTELHLQCTIAMDNYTKLAHRIMSSLELVTLIELSVMVVPTHKPKWVMKISEDDGVLVWHTSGTHPMIAFKQLFAAFSGSILESCSFKVSVNCQWRCYRCANESQTLSKNPSQGILTCLRV